MAQEFKNRVSVWVPLHQMQVFSKYITSGMIA